MVDQKLFPKCFPLKVAASEITICSGQPLLQYLFSNHLESQCQEHLVSANRRCSCELAGLVDELDSRWELARLPFAAC